MHLYPDPAWSPDGTRVLFTSNRGGTPWLYTVRADGSALSRLPLPNRITGAHQGDWSRDGRIIFSLWGQTPVNPAKMSAEAPAPATLVYSPTPTPTVPAMVVMSAPEAVTGYNRIISYEYDSLYRLTGATYTEGTSVSEYAYGYDLRGNRTSVTAPGVGTFSYSYNLANQINYPDFTYDPNGNLTADGYTTYTYDAANRLRGVVTGVDASTYQYDGLGNRIGMTHNNVETAYLLDPSGALSQVLRETTGGVNTLYLHGLDIIGQQRGSTWTTLGYDPLGSVRFVLDSTGTLTHALNYDPYGVPLQPNTESTSLGFTGEQTDPNDLVYLRARYYHPKLGTFTSVDPVLGVGGSTGWNGYLYANANPANLTDPSGACIGPLTFLLPACIGALAGFGVGAGLDTAGQVAYIAQHDWNWSLYNPGQALRAGAIGAAGGAVGAGVIGASALGASYLHITAGASSALAYGVGTIAVSGMVGGRAAKLTENALYHRPLDQGLWNLGDIARDALLAVGGTWAFGSVANALTRGNTNYFTAFLPRSFMDLMPTSEAARYRGYWRDVESRPFMTQMSLDDAARYSQYWDGVIGGHLKSNVARIRAVLEQEGSIQLGQRNVSLAMADLDELFLTVRSVSGQRGIGSIPVTVPVVPQHKAFFTSQTIRGFPRNNDAEYKVLEYLSRILTENAQGTIYLYTERFPCQSCWGVISNQFVKEFPSVDIKLFWGR